eukprot:Hpha_TRINITY_DN25071_c0_g1::TRINITY_DN25071_c0_g1_i1::g.109746::m.109746
MLKQARCCRVYWKRLVANETEGVKGTCVVVPSAVGALEITRSMTGELAEESEQRWRRSWYEWQENSWRIAPGKSGDDEDPAGDCYTARLVRTRMTRWAKPTQGTYRLALKAWHFLGKLEVEGFEVGTRTHETALDVLVRADTPHAA